MKLIKPVNSLKKSKRVGRGPGSGLGKTAGRGHKGAGQRSGFKHRYWFEGGQMPLYRRLPKRGFNPIKRKKIAILNLLQLQKLISDNKIKNKNLINLIELKKSKVFKNRVEKIKLLGNGDLKEKIYIEVNFASKSAKEKIEKNGGSIKLIDKKTNKPPRNE